MSAFLDDAIWRRKTRETLCDPSTVAILERIGVGPGWSCWEAGAGYGSIAAWLSNAVGLTGMVWATEVHDNLLMSLEAIAAPKLRVARHDLERDAFPNDRFDLIHSRFVLEHLSARDEILKAWVEALKPGGWLVVEDCCFGGASLSGPTSFVRVMQTLESVAGSRGSDFRWSATLPHTLTKMKLSQVSASGTLRFFQGDSLEARFWEANVRDAALDENLTLAGEMQDCCDALRVRTNWFCGPAIICAVGRRS
jgi:SAM-dependent methyltransferase